MIGTTNRYHRRTTIASGRINLMAKITHGSIDRETTISAESGELKNSPACSRPRANVRDVIPYVNDPQYRVVADNPANISGDETVINLSMFSYTRRIKLADGYLIMYLNWHCGQ